MRRKTRRLLNNAIRETNDLVIHLIAEPLPEWAKDAVLKADVLLNNVRDGLEDEQ